MSSAHSDQISRSSGLLDGCGKPRCRWQHTHDSPHGYQNESADLIASENNVSDVWVRTTQQQIEYYFSDRNLQKDKYLLSRTGPAGTDFVDLADLCTFNRLKKLSSDSGLSSFELVGMAVERSVYLELSSDKLSLRRRKPIRKAQSRFIGSMWIASEPNVYWCHITMEELRAQERFLALPAPSDLKIDGPATWSWIRQDDSLWDELHWGVLTTRHLKGIFGFHEPQAGAFLGLARNMIDHNAAVGAYQDLLEAPEASAYHAQYQLGRGDQAENERSRRAFNHGLMSSTSRHVPPMRRHGRFTSLSQVRCSWGSAQEASALKQMLEAEEIVAAGGILEEVGLCMFDPGRLAERQDNVSISTSSSCQKTRRWKSTSPSKIATLSAAVYPLMGASPDAMLRFSNEELVSVEVKNVCPFFDHNGSFAVHGSYESPDNRSTVPFWRLRGPAENLPTAYVPQAQWEMFVTDSTKNYFVSASALQGVNIFIVERDDKYIDLMLHVIADFYQEFVLAGIAPGHNFFWDRPCYMELLERSRSICNSTLVSIRLPPRPDAATHDLFLDQARQIMA